MNAKINDIHEAIRARRSIGKMRDELPPRDAIERIIEAGTWAPFHKVTEPWRFVVISGKARSRLGEIAARTLDLTGIPPEVHEAVRAKERGKFERAPYVVAVVVAPADNPIDFEENYASAAAATQNMMLAAHAEELAAYWRTGRLAREPEILKELGVADGERIAAFLYLGFPALVPKSATRAPASEKTRWIT